MVKVSCEACKAGPALQSFAMLHFRHAIGSEQCSCYKVVQESLTSQVLLDLHRVHVIRLIKLISLHTTQGKVTCARCWFALTAGPLLYLQSSKKGKKRLFRLTEEFPNKVLVFVLHSVFFLQTFHLFDDCNKQQCLL